MGNPGGSAGSDGTTVVGAPVTPSPAVPTGAPRGPGRAALAGLSSRRMLGWALVVGWVVWLAALWVTQPRLVPPDALADELATGHVVAYRVVAVDEDRGHGAWSPYRLDLWPASDARDGVVDDAADGRPVSVAYWVDSPVARLRVLDPNGLSSDTPSAAAARLAGAGVPEAAAGDFYRGLPADRVYDAGVLLLVMGTVVVVFGPRPRRGTRWFWFWVVGGPLSVGVPIFAVAELLRPRYEPDGTVHPPGVAGRWSGLTGFAAGVVLSVVGVAALLALNAVSPIWFVRG